MKNLKSPIQIKPLVSTLAAGLILSLASLAQAADLDLSGNHKGTWHRSNHDVDVHLMIKPIPGRQGSFLGLLVRLDPKVVVYLIDPLSGPGSTSFSMVPAQVSDDGEIGWDDDNPSLVLNVTGEDHGKPIFNIINANSGNYKGFQGSFEFKRNGTSRYEWVNAEPGRYKKSAFARETISIGMLSTDGEATVDSSGGPLAGNYQMRTKLPGVYTLRAKSVKNTGEEVELFPRKLVVFIKRNGMLSNDIGLFLVKPADDNDVEILERR